MRELSITELNAISGASNNDFAAGLLLGIFGGNIINPSPYYYAPVVYDPYYYDPYYYEPYVMYAPVYAPYGYYTDTYYIY